MIVRRLGLAVALGLLAPCASAGFTKLDLPPAEWQARWWTLDPLSVAGNRTAAMGPDFGAQVGEGLGAWGSSYLVKKSLEGRLGGGKTLPAPLWRQGDFRLLILLPIEQRTLDFRAVPVGAILRLGILGQ